MGQAGKGHRQRTEARATLESHPSGSVAFVAPWVDSQRLRVAGNSRRARVKDRMIGALRLKNYRSFEEYELRKLARVNLLVGQNNCGKTSILEAVRLLVSGGDPRILIESARRRSESSTEADEEARRAIRYPLYHQFHGHTFGLGTSLSISSDDGLGRVRMEIVEAEAKEPQDLFEVFEGTTPPLALKIRRATSTEDILISLAEDGSIDWRAPAMRHRSFGASNRKLPPTQFVTAESLQPREMAGVWNQVEMQGRETEVVESMRILQEDLDSIRFLSGDVSGRSGPPPSIVLGFRAGAPRFPIGSYGDGMRRLLALSLSLMRAAKGFLLIDEIDTGLHWSVMEEMWKLVVETAIRSSIQVFATTHSLDCILGLAELLRTREDLGDSVVIQKIERGINRSVSFDAEAIVTATDLGVELR